MSTPLAELTEVEDRYHFGYCKGCGYKKSARTFEGKNYCQQCKPEHPTPDPLPTATIGQVDSPQRFSRQSTRWQFTALRATNFCSTFRDNTGFADMWAKGECVAYQFSDGRTYNIDFAIETDDNLHYVIMYVNGRIERVYTYAYSGGYYNLLERNIRVDGRIVTTVPAYAILNTSLRDCALMMEKTYMLMLERKAHHVSAPDMKLLPAPKADAELRVGQVVHWINPVRGFTTQTYEVDEIKGDWIAIRHPYIKLKKWCKPSELQAVAA